MGKIDEANKEYRRALELSPKNALAANNLAANLSDFGGNLDEALKFAQVAREAAPEDPNVADTLGWIYFKKGLFDTAYPLISDASKKLEKNAVVRYHHGMVLSKKGKTKEAAAELQGGAGAGREFPGGGGGEEGAGRPEIRKRGDAWWNAVISARRRPPSWSSLSLWSTVMVTCGACSA